MRFPKNKAHLFIVVARRQNAEWDESKHPRNDDGTFGDGQGGGVGKAAESPVKGSKYTVTSREERQRKIDSVRIDFDRDNTLPGLNAEDLAKLGKADKPVLLKKGIIEKNLLHHPEVSRDEYARIIGQSLYNPDGIYPGSSSEPRFNFMSRVGPNKSTITLLEMAETKGSYEIINLHMIKDRQRKQKER